MLFYTRREVVGIENIPPQGAVLFAGTTETLSSTRYFGLWPTGHPLLLRLRIIFKICQLFLDAVVPSPSGKQDHGSDETGKVAIHLLLMLCSVLKNGGCMGIFPEGASHNESQLAPFKTSPASLLSVQPMKRLNPSISCRVAFSIQPWSFSKLDRYPFRQERDNE